MAICFTPSNECPVLINNFDLFKAALFHCVLILLPRQCEAQITLYDPSAAVFVEQISLLHASIWNQSHNEGFLDCHSADITEGNLAC